MRLATSLLTTVVALFTVSAALAQSNHRNISRQDHPAQLLKDPQTLVRNLKEIEELGLVKGEVTVQPWSDDYWPVYKGQIAQRYNDVSFAVATEFAGFLEAFRAITPAKLLEIFDPAVTPSSLDRLSPAEKYDLLVGDPDFSLTKSQWAPGERYQVSQGQVENWMGLCHGWAPASFMLSRPSKMITLKTKVGEKPLNFYPSDIKALATLLWAQSAPSARMIGNRCQTKEVARDAKGRIKDEACFNTNPGTFHSALATIVGREKRSFILDITYDYEVWNQPIRDYQVTYFNVATDRESDKFQDVVVKWRQYRKDDPYRRSRGGRFTNPEYIVGVRLSLNYMSETDPSPKETDSSVDDEVTSVEYEYDLELDRDFNILGGEWRSDDHPDFLWSYDAGARALTRAEKLGLTNGATFTNETIPDAWMNPARASSQIESAPLGAIVEELIRRAN